MMTASSNQREKKRRKAAMKQEYSFTLTTPLQDLEQVDSLLQQVKERYPQIRISRKTDRKGNARHYLSFPFSAARPDLHFQEWFEEKLQESWDLFGPTYGRWGLS